ncbi:OmpH family outer membrane protein [Niabella beijingensis]|uniref:OmpH family outer membrane protein n=1 Tax=Niabella beijingensis TaxID=2872700 RepID=UPI001CBF626A|nr:OmpH family outer membrane protein [Niabella beijingensis]MBZ4188226.1 OmpH family outer membrane protein [Niabella beijingensis]
MKNALLVVNALLVIAVGFLLFKQFGGTTERAPHADDVISKGKDSLMSRKAVFAYIDMDSIQEHYDLAKSVQGEVEKKKSAITVELDKMEKSFKAKVGGYQQQSNTMTDEQAMAARQDVETTQAQMMDKRQSLMDDFNNFVSSKNLSVKKKIEDFLKVFNADRTFSFIFAYEPGLFYYKDTVYDITKEVVKGLNEQYAKEKK